MMATEFPSRWMKSGMIRSPAAAAADDDDDDDDDESSSASTTPVRADLRATWYLLAYLTDSDLPMASIAFP